MQYPFLLTSIVYKSSNKHSSMIWDKDLAKKNTNFFYYR